ncbi:MAG: hypothetical protein AAF401_18625 [Pseudomonadota bacterium]
MTSMKPMLTTLAAATAIYVGGAMVPQPADGPALLSLVTTPQAEAGEDRRETRRIARRTARRVERRHDRMDDHLTVLPAGCVWIDGLTQDYWTCGALRYVAVQDQGRTVYVVLTD